MKPFVFALGLALTVSGGCLGVRTPPPDLPGEQEVDRVAIETNKKLGTPATDAVIEDRARIRLITRFLDAHSEDWRKAQLAFPAAFYSVTLSGPLGFRTIWIGRDWIGTRDDSNGLYRMLTAEEAHEFRDLLAATGQTVT